jgi:hypothetical protein
VGQRIIAVISATQSKASQQWCGQGCLRAIRQKWAVGTWGSPEETRSCGFEPRLIDRLSMGGKPRRSAQAAKSAMLASQWRSRPDIAPFAADAIAPRSIRSPIQTAACPSAGQADVGIGLRGAAPVRRSRQRWTGAKDRISRSHVGADRRHHAW